MRSNIFCHLLNKLGVKYTESFCKSFYEGHPHKNNLYGLSRMLSTYKIDNIGVQLEDKSQINNIECPFIAYKDNDFVIVETANSKVSYWWRGKLISLTLKEFIDSWSGIALIPEITNESAEPDYSKNRIKKIVESVCNFLFFALLFVFGLYAFIISEAWNDLYRIALVPLILCGLAVSYFLVQKHFHSKSQLGDKICSLFSKADCNNLLDSEASTLFGIFSWSEIGFSYFASSLIIVIFYPELFPYLFLINICTTPYTLWSIWYQVRAKQWCQLCLIANGILVFITSIMLFFIIETGFPSLQLSHLVSLGFIYLFPFIFIHQFLKIVIQSQSIERVTYELNSIKSNPDLIEMLLNKQPHFEVSLENSQILMGNPNAKTLITILTNPHCNPCAKMHMRVGNLLKRCGDRFCVQYIYSSFHSSNDDSAKALIAAYFLHKDRYEELLHEWFLEGKHNPLHFFMKYDLHNFSMEVESEYSKHTEWKEKNKIYSTPRLLIDGYSLPEYYQIEDLMVIDF